MGCPPVLALALTHGTTTEKEASRIGVRGFLSGKQGMAVWEENCPCYSGCVHGRHITQAVRVVNCNGSLNRPKCKHAKHEVRQQECMC